jgi:D-3-phosphoglycerate dehydrogenase / 2-oxoglutarate reductase
LNLNIQIDYISTIDTLRKLKIVVTSQAASLKDILYTKLNDLGLTAETIDYNKPMSSQIANADILINGLGKIDKAIIDSCPNLKLVHQIGTGIDNIDIDLCTSKSIYVSNVPGVNNISVAEHTLFLMIYLAKNMKGAGTSLMKRRVVNILGSELKDKTLAIIGLGATGTEVAKRAKSFSMKVIAITKNPHKYNKVKTTIVDDNDDDNNDKLDYFIDEIRSLQHLSRSISQADYISIHTPLTNETLGLIGYDEIGVMKKSGYLVNVARAQVVNREALFRALSEQKIRGAAFDVFWEEPADPEDKLLKLDNFVLTPHIAGWTAESVETATSMITTNIKRIMNGEVPLNIVNAKTS